MAKDAMGLIRSGEAYSKQMLMTRLGISQKFWDKMIKDGLPYTPMGHARWVTGQDVIEYLLKHAERFSPTQPPRGVSDAEESRNRSSTALPATPTQK